MSPHVLHALLWLFCLLCEPASSSRSQSGEWELARLSDEQVRVGHGKHKGKNHNGQQSGKGKRNSTSDEEFKFTDKKAHNIKWLMNIVKKTQPLNKEGEEELEKRKRQKFKTKGPRTFLITVGGMGAGKGYAMSRVFKGEAGDVLGSESDYATVDPDDVRQGSETFKEILAFAKDKKLEVPKDLIANNNLFTCRGGPWDGQNCSWIKVTHTYNFRVLKKLYLDSDAGTSIIYDSACTDLAYCEGLLTTASKIGFEKLVVMWVHVPVKCSHYRAAVVRPKQQGRFTNRKNVFQSWEKATKNAPKLFKKVKELAGSSQVKSWVTIKSTGKGSKKDKHECWEETRLEVDKGFGKTSKGSQRFRGFGKVWGVNRK